MEGDRPSSPTSSCHPSPTIPARQSGRRSTPNSTSPAKPRSSGTSTPDCRSRQTRTSSLAATTSCDVSNEDVADMLSSGLILGWVNGRYEIGPRALGNRSILAAPFDDSTRVRLNEIKQREQFRPIAPVCLEDDAARWFGCDHESPYMLYTYRATTDALRRGDARERHRSAPDRQRRDERSTPRPARRLQGAHRIRSPVQHVSELQRQGLHQQPDRPRHLRLERELDGFVVEGRAYLRRGSERYATYQRDRARDLDQGRLGVWGGDAPRVALDRESAGSLGPSGR